LSPGRSTRLPRSYEAALAGFTKDSFNDTDSAIGAVAASGQPARHRRDPGAAGRPPALRGDKVFIRDKAGAMLDAATGKPAASAPADLKTVRLNNRLRRSVEARSAADAARADPAKRYEAAQAVFKSRDANALPTLDAALAKETDSAREAALDEARAAVILFQADAKENDKLDADRGDPRARRPGCARAARRPAERAAALVQKRGRATPIASIDNRLALWSEGAECLVRALARLGAAARRDRPRHHVRRDGRHQHGAWRDGDARRLHDFHGAGDHSFALSRPVRRLAVHRGTARVRLRGLRGIVIERCVIRFLYGRPLETLLATWGLSLILQQAVRTDVRTDQQGSRQSVLDERRVRARRHHGHL
jgi:urea transport system permease protein